MLYLASINVTIEDSCRFRLVFYVIILNNRLEIIICKICDCGLDDYFVLGGYDDKEK